MPPPIEYSETAPPEALADVVRSLWRFSASHEVPPGTFTLPPDPCLSLALVEQGTRLVLRILGPHLRPLDVPVGPGAVVEGVRMRPEAAGLLLGLDPRSWADRVDEAAHHAPALASAVTSHDTLEAGRTTLLGALANCARLAPSPDPLVRRAIEEIETACGDVTVSALSARLGVSTRTLQRRFSAATGLSPKPFARVRRFLLASSNVLRAAPEAWGRVAADHGFADQAHFTRECIALTGLPPTAFAERLARIRHVDVEP